MSFTDNWTGVHPGGGFLLVVDAHKQALLAPPIPGYGALPLNTLAQIYDATFGLLPAPSMTIRFMIGGRLVARDYQGLGALPLFDDAHSYWNQQTPAASVMTPTYGLLFRVVGQASDGSAALIGLGTK